MATDIIARGMAANAKKSVTELGNKVESEKWIGTKAEWEAVDKSTIKDGTIVYITDDETVILYDKAEMEKIATQVATDRKAAETAAQTAQAVADSLPDDYTTAVGKIAENTAEIGRVKMSDKELKRRVDALYSIGQGITHRFETDSETAYAKTVPTGAKLMSVKSVGGRSIVWNQLVKPVPAVVTGAGVKATFSDDGIITLNGTATTTGSAVSVQPVKNQKGHKYLMIANPLSGVYGKDQLQFSSQSYGQDSTGHGTIITNESSNEKWYYTLYVYEGVTYDNVKLQPQIFDLTAMFGSSNEPTSVEEFEKMFPADYYPYNAGEIVSAGTESVVEQGKNLWNLESYTASDLVDLKTGYWGVKLSVKPNSTYCISVTRDTALCGTYGKLIGADKREIKFFGHKTTSDINAYTGHPVAFQTADEDYVYVAINSFNGFDTWKSDLLKYFPSFQIEKSSTATAYAPFHSNVYPIPEAIRNLPGYGWSAGTARNYVDYENKKYYKCVDSMDLGTVNWQVETSPTFGTYFSTFVDSRKFKKIGDFTQKRHNILCDKYLTVKRDVKEYVDKTILLDGTVSVVTQIQVKDTAYTDATAFKQAMSGVMLCYELANPIVTDMSSLLPDDFLRNMEVEALGSVTFKNSNGDDYRIPVPSEEEYIVKLSEVGGTT